MTSNEKEKMLRGEPYRWTDEVLTAEREHARHFFQQLNQSPPNDRDTYHEIREQLFPNAADDFWVEPPFYCDYGYNIHTGTNVFFNFNCVMLDACAVTIGSNVMIGPNVQIYTATHPLPASQRRAGVEFGIPVTIGDDCWLGGGVIICPGVSIGNGCVIGAGAVVTKDIPEGMIAAGNPARVIKKAPAA